MKLYTTEAMLEKVLEYKVKRDKRYAHLLIKKLPLIANVREWCYVGGSTLTFEKRRLMVEADALPIAGMFATETEVTRDYLRSKYPKRLKAFREQAEYFKSGEHVQPMHALPGSYADMAYVDLKAAYWTVLQAVGWDADYNPGKWLARRSEMSDYPLPHLRLGRNSLVTLGLPTPSRVWTGYNLKYIQSGNPILNTGIWALVQDVLHVAASIAALHGAVYVNTDGYIVRRERVGELVAMLYDFGVGARVKHEGDAVIKAVGAYRIGEHVTDTYDKLNACQFSNLRAVDFKWWGSRFSPFAHKAQFFYGERDAFNTVDRVALSV